MHNRDNGAATNLSVVEIFTPDETIAERVWWSWERVAWDLVNV